MIDFENKLVEPDILNERVGGVCGTLICIGHVALQEKFRVIRESGVETLGWFLTDLVDDDGIVDIGFKEQLEGNVLDDTATDASTSPSLDARTVLCVRHRHVAYRNNPSKDRLD